VHHFVLFHPARRAPAPASGRRDEAAPARAASRLSHRCYLLVVLVVLVADALLLLLLALVPLPELVLTPLTARQGIGCWRQ
jgi:hypothetical protein